LSSLTPVILSWEYPPRIVGDMAHQIDHLTSELNKANIPIMVVTCHASPYLYERRSSLLELFWASNPVEPQISVITWCLTLNSEIERIVADLYYSRGRIDLLDVHEWHFISAGTNLKRALGIPFIFTIHSLEDQRSPDTSSPLSSCIKGLERMGARESDLVITKSDSMKEEIMKIHEIPQSKIIVAPTSGKDWIEKIVKSYRKITPNKRG
jgi:1,4-alpha-glucan branching enzyme